MSNTLSFNTIKTNIEKLSEIHADKTFDGTIIKSRNATEIGIPLLAEYGIFDSNLLKALTENNNIPDESVSTPFKQITFKKKN
jgi:hypothetical protein